MIKYSSNYYANNIEKCKEQSRIRTKEMRLKIIEILGGKCVACEYSKDWRALEIDHVNGDGFKERKRYKSGYRGSSIYHKFRAIVADKSRFQLLCSNCHRIKTFESKEHHKHRDTPKVVDKEVMLL